MSSAVTTANSPVPDLNIPDFNGLAQQIMDTTRANNEWSASQAAIQRDWQTQANRIAMDFNAAEAAKSRDWQQYMSNTAHQREVADLKAAGLNPVLSATGGNGAAVTSGATASGVTSSGAKGDADTSANSALVSLIGGMLNAQTQLQMANISAINNMAIADKQNAVAREVAAISAAATRYAADKATDRTQMGIDNPTSLWGTVNALVSGAAGADGLLPAAAQTVQSAKSAASKVLDSYAATPFHQAVSKATDWFLSPLHKITGNRKK